MNKYMDIAYKEALKAYKKKEVPVGAVIVRNNKIIAKAHNSRQRKYNLFGHAEIECIKKAEKAIKDWRLDNCEMYVTLLPCEMCELCLKKSRINKVYYLLNQDSISLTNSKTTFVQTNECVNLQNSYHEILTNFFKNLRK